MTAEAVNPVPTLLFATINLCWTLVQQNLHRCVITLRFCGFVVFIERLLQEVSNKYHSYQVRSEVLTIQDSRTYPRRMPLQGPQQLHIPLPERGVLARYSWRRNLSSKIRFQFTEIWETLIFAMPLNLYRQWRTPCSWPLLLSGWEFPYCAILGGSVVIGHSICTNLLAEW